MGLSLSIIKTKQMKARDLLRLPLGEYELTDDIYNYQLKKGLTDDNSIVYVIIEKRTRNLFCLFEKEIIDEEYYGDFFKRIILSVCISIGGFTVHSNDISYGLYSLKFAPNGSFKEFINKTK